MRWPLTDARCVPLVLSLSCLPLALNGQAVRACGLQRAGPERPLSGDVNRHTYVEAPTLLTHGGRSFLVGPFTMLTHMDSLGSVVSFRRGFGVWQEADSIRDIPLPPNRDFLLAPAAATTATGLHVIWGEGATVGSRTTRAVSFADYSVATGWTEVQSLEMPAEVRWTPLQRTRLVSRGDTLFLAAPMDPYDGNFALLTRVRDRWAVRVVESPPRLYLAMVSVGSELVLLGIEPSRRGQPGGLHLTRSPDGGSTWSPWEPIHRLGPGQEAFDSHLFVRPDGSLLAVWTVSASPDSFGDSVVIAEQPVRGSWHSLARVSIPRYWGMWAAVDAAFGVHAFVRRLHEADLYYVHWSRSEVCAGPVPESRGALPSPLLLSAASRRLEILMSVQVSQYLLPSSRIRPHRVCC